MGYFFDFGIFIKKYLRIIKLKTFLYITLIISLLSILVLFNVLGLDHKYYNDVSIINIIPKLIVDTCMFSLFLNIPQASKVFNYFCKNGKYSLIFYLVHAPLISATRSIILKFWVPNVFILVIILLCIGWFGSLIVVYLSNNLKIIHFVFNSYSMVQVAKNEANVKN